MFVRDEYDEDDRRVDPRDVPATPTSSLCRSRLPRYAAVLNESVDGLDAGNQLALADEVSACLATLEWVRCRLASGFAIQDFHSPLVQAARRRPGGIVSRRLGGPDTPEVAESTITELALSLGCSERLASDYIAVGLDLRFRLRCTNNDFGGGRLTWAHARVISESTRLLSTADAERLDERLADAAQTRTPARLRVLARRLAAKADPTAMARRHARAYDERGVAFFPLDDGIAAMCLDHRLEVMAVVDDQLERWARHRRSLDAATATSAHKADAALLLLLGRHPVTGRDLLRSAPEDDGVGQAQAAVSDPDAVQTTTSAICLPGPEDVLPAHTELRVTMSADTLIGLDDTTCELDGHGPITAAQARRLALDGPASILRRLFTDPADDSVRFLDARTYRFTASQAESIRALHPMSTFPGATTPARHCDLDHRVPYRTGPPDPAGQTVVANAQPLGRRHHRIRTHVGWTCQVDPVDQHTTYWTSPYGRRYVSQDAAGA